MKKIIQRSMKLMPAFAILAVAATGRPADVAPGPDTPSVEAVRKATARFTDIAVARAEGWSLALTGCMESAEGGMGYHFGNEALLGDGGELEPTRPEALLYEPRQDGSMELVAVEYLVPFPDWKGDEAPVFMDHGMIANEEFGVWTLHLWLRSNPKGTFVGWNPDVTCDFATTDGK